MIYSMTGYAVVTIEVPHGSLSLELRAVNSRYLDIHFRLPDEFRMLEPTMRKILTAQLNRGKIECRLNCSMLSSVEYPQQINSDLFLRLLELNQTVQSALPEAQSLGVADVLKWPGILENDSLSAEDLQQTCIDLLDSTLNEFLATRAREGAKLKAMIFDRLSQMRQLVITVSPRIPDLLSAFQHKLKARIQDAEIDPEDDRMRQEITIFANKIDIDEELSRLRTHLDELERILHKGGPVGKRLDFLMQELNREANTIGSKSIDVEISRFSIELKVLIEQIREQVQNLE
jgi:uncharacterized protein (TIGR00255 family)